MMPLLMARRGETNKISAVRGKDEIKRFLANLGFVEGSAVTVISEIDGNLIVNVKDARIALSSQNIYLMQVEDVMKTLKEVPVGETVTVAKLVGEGAVKRRIMDMGVTKGVSVFVRKVAPLGDPVEVTVRGYELTLRNGEAEHIVVE